MQSVELLSETLAIVLARECLYRFLALAMNDPHRDGWHFVLDPENQRLACSAADLLRGEMETGGQSLGLGELPAEHFDLRPLLKELEKPLPEICAAYDAVFGLLLNRECPPYETEYHSSSETFFRSQQLADIAGFYRAFGLEPGQESPERPDYLPLELEFMAFLLMKKRLAGDLVDQDSVATERVQICEEAERTFFGEHLAWWVPAFVMGLRRKAGDGMYSALAQLLAAFLSIEGHHFGLAPPCLPLQPALIERPEEEPGCAGCTGSS